MESGMHGIIFSFPEFEKSLNSPPHPPCSSSCQKCQPKGPDGFRFRFRFRLKFRSDSDSEQCRHVERAKILHFWCFETIGRWSFQGVTDNVLLPQIQIRTGNTWSFYFCITDPCTRLVVQRSLRERIHSRMDHQHLR